VRTRLNWETDDERNRTGTQDVGGARWGMSRHTPGKWISKGHLVINSDGNGICNMARNMCIPTEHKNEFNVVKAPMEANARRIVTAVNAHDDLVEACEDALWTLEYLARKGHVHDEDNELLRAALALAEGEGT